MQKYFLTAFLSVLSLCLSAQQKSDARATAIIDRAAAKFDKGAFATDIKLSIKEPDKEKPENQNLSAKLSGNKLYVKSADMEIFFDGKTQWVYYEQLNEVTITEPDAKELEILSPIAVFKNYKNKYRVIFEEDIKSDKYYIISLLPYDKTDDIFRIRVTINRANYEISKVEVSQRNGQKMTFALDTYKTIAPNADTFSFSSKNHPRVSINDLR
ncbi:MAG: outer membrane lipoprotein carrier protein LolA [Prevotellaceae bacterium]|jgi:outer membrane lipoprotein-sorting protein|nr:outer membrane lipoprotein carrier protein LolA [Prevotellaceae bacterium]